MLDEYTIKHIYHFVYIGVLGELQEKTCNVRTWIDDRPFDNPADDYYYEDHFNREYNNDKRRKLILSLVIYRYLLHGAVVEFVDFIQHHVDNFISTFNEVSVYYMVKRLIYEKLNKRLIQLLIRNKFNVKLYLR